MTTPPLRDKRGLFLAVPNSRQRRTQSASGIVRVSAIIGQIRCARKRRHARTLRLLGAIGVAQHGIGRHPISPIPITPPDGGSSAPAGSGRLEGPGGLEGPLEGPGGPAEERHATAERLLGTTHVVKRAVGSAESRRASRAWWDADADDYQAEHGDFLGNVDFVWCPEGLREADAKLLGDVRGAAVLEVGCGSASCARWLAAEGADVVGLDLSAGMLEHALRANAATGHNVPLVQASADALPFATGSFDIACSAFGAVPFVADLGAVMRELARVLRPGGRLAFAVTHPMRWIFPDDPGPVGLTAMQSYFDRTPYVEVDDQGRATYVEYHRTLGDLVGEISRAGFYLFDLVEPEWPQDHLREWGQWSPLRGRLFPGTAIFCCGRL